jgi:hypothetical protein
MCRWLMIQFNLLCVCLIVFAVYSPFVADDVCVLINCI